MIKKLRTVAITSIVLLTTPLLIAQETPIGLTATTSITLGTDSNVFRLSDEQVSDKSIAIAPKLKFFERYGKHEITAEYNGRFTRFEDIKSLNFDEHKGGLNARLEHSSRFKTEYTYRYENIVELPGVNNSTTQAVGQYNKLNQQVFSVKGTYGRNDAIGQAMLQYDHAERNYTNNNQDFRDYGFSRIVGVFFYRVAPNTRLLFETSISEVEYSRDIFNQDSDYTNYLVGAEWQLSDKTSGILKIGHQNQKFDNINYDEITGLAYFADIYWKPNSYSSLQLGASRSTRESSEANVGSFVATDFTLKAAHEFTPRFILDVFYSFSKDDVVLGNNLTLKRNQLDVKVLYKTNRVFDIYFGIKHFSRKSDTTIYELKNNQLIFGFLGYFGHRSY